MAKTNNNLQLFYQNVRGLRTKTNTFYNNLHLSNADIILITESWLHEGILDTELASPGRYDLFRRDRGAYAGGVMIACASRLAATTMCDLDINDVEVIGICISARSLGSQHNFIIFCVYIPPDNALPRRVNNFIEFLSIFVSNHPNDDILIAGDFNLSCVDWSSEVPTFLKKGSSDKQEAAQKLITSATFLGLSQYNFL